MNKLRRRLPNGEQAAPKGRVWWNPDGLWYWSCTACVEKILRKTPGWQDVEPGGRAYTASDGNDYVTEHWRTYHRSTLSRELPPRILKDSPQA